MPRSRGLFKLETYRLDIDAADELRVGRHARRVLMRRLAMALSGVALIAAAAWLYGSLAADGPAAADTFVAVAQCRACGARQEAKFRLAGDAPPTCRACAKAALAPLWRCEECKAEFLADEGRTDLVRCPSCGGASVGAAPREAPPGG